MSKPFEPDIEPDQNSTIDFSQLANDIKSWGLALGFQQVGITDTRLDDAEHHLMNWLNAGFHGEMAYMAKHGTKRSRPGELEPGTISVISATLNYWPQTRIDSKTVLDDPELAFVSRYALGRDYHKMIRLRLQKLARKIENVVGKYGYRVFTDSAPVLEKALAEKAGLGWIGKHSNLLQEQVGSWFFIGEIYTNLPLPCDTPSQNHCGTCSACIEACPTNAIIAPYKVDARRCISYLTIELKGSIPEEFRAQLGNRIYGCDDCQMVCPWNRFAVVSNEGDFYPRHELDTQTLISLFNWSEEEFLRHTEGSAIRRIGHERWLRNIAVALGNMHGSREIIIALNKKLQHPSELVREHVLWALQQHNQSY